MSDDIRDIRVDLSGLEHCQYCGGEIDRAVEDYRLFGHAPLHLHCYITLGDEMGDDDEQREPLPDDSGDYSPDELIV